MEPTTTLSESIANICAALAEAQGAFKPILKNRTVEVATKSGGTYTFTYATLDSVIDSTREALAANGICHTAMIHDGILTVKLIHRSGEWFGSSVQVPPSGSGWQAFGSAITYARRYLLTPLLGVASEEDDDGNAAEGNQVSTPDPFAKLWTALERLGIYEPAEQRTWCETALARSLPNADSMTAADLPKLLEAAKRQAEPAPQAKPADVKELALRLAAELGRLLPPAKRADDASKKEINDANKAAMLYWANGFRPREKQISGFGQLTADELQELIAKAKAGEMPTPEPGPDWMNNR
jgi:hypothetical protein